jgi:hypothetical protein
MPAFDPASPYGINTHLPPPAHLDRVAAAGIAWIRVDFNMDQLQPAPGQYNWALTDQVVQDARARGLHLYPTLAYAPPWANGGGGRNVPPDPEAWYGFVATVVLRYRDRIRHWGMWNEPNLKGFWSGSVAQYVNGVLEPGALAVREYAPEGLVCGPDLAMERDWASWLRTILSRGGHRLDVVTQHSYQASGREVLRRMGGTGWRWPWQDPTVREIMAETGAAGKPLWLTETGWNTADVSEDQQASYIDQVLEGFPSYGIGKVFVYQLADEAHPVWYGVLHQDLTPKPAYLVYQRRTAAPAIV